MPTDSAHVLNAIVSAVRDALSPDLISPVYLTARGFRYQDTDNRAVSIKANDEDYIHRISGVPLVYVTVDVSYGELHVSDEMQRDTLRLAGSGGVAEHLYRIRASLIGSYLSNLLTVAMTLERAGSMAVDDHNPEWIVGTDTYRMAYTVEVA